MKSILLAVLNLLGILLICFAITYILSAVLIALNAPRLIVVILGLATGFTASRVLTKFMATKIKNDGE